MSTKLSDHTSDLGARDSIYAEIITQVLTQSHSGIENIEQIQGGIGRRKGLKTRSA